jgi:hypothetical protein
VAGPCRGGNAAYGGAQKALFVLCVPFVFFVLKNPARSRAGDGVGGLMTPPNPPLFKGGECEGAPCRGGKAACRAPKKPPWRLGVLAF